MTDLLSSAEHVAVHNYLYSNWDDKESDVNQVTLPFSHHWILHHTPLLPPSPGCHSLVLEKKHQTCQHTHTAREDNLYTQAEMNKQLHSH